MKFKKKIMKKVSIKTINNFIDKEFETKETELRDQEIKGHYHLLTDEDDKKFLNKKSNTSNGKF